MTEKDVKDLIDERRRLLGEMAGLSTLLHGTWLERHSTCSRPGCACHQGRRHGPRRYLVVYEEGRQRQCYIPAALEDAVRAGLSEHRRLQQIVARLTQINLSLLRRPGGEASP